MERVERLEKRLRKKTEALQHSEKRHRALLTLLRYAADGAFLFQDGAFLWKNRKFQELSGSIKASSSLHDPGHVFFVQSLNEYLKRVEEESARPGGLPSFKWAFACRDSGRLAVRAFPVMHRGKWALQGIVRRIVAEKEGNGLNKRLLAMTIHELRTAVTLISGYNRALLNKETGPLNPAQKRILEESRLSCDRLIGFAGEFLEISRGGSEKMTINPQENAIDACIKTVCGQLNPLAREKGLALKVNLPAEGLPSGYFDKQRMEQVLINLIKNAIQYTPEGGGIEVTATSDSHFSPAVKVSVADSGAGIPAKDRRKIFREFMIGKNSHNGEAVGLGLAVCKKIVEAHNGKIWLESAKGTGNRFIFTLPMTKP